MPPLILAVDTTHESGSLALARGTEILEELSIVSPDGFAHVLYGHIAALLARHNVTLAAIGLFAAAAGPGSFTGVRVGLACVKGLAEATGKPAVGISNLAALSLFGTSPFRGVALDARRDETYVAVYDSDARLISPEIVIRFSAWIETLLLDQSLSPSRGDFQFVSPDFSSFSPALDASPYSATPRIPAPQSLASAVARLAYLSEPQDPAALDANYVRRSDAELLWKG